MKSRILTLMCCTCLMYVESVKAQRLILDRLSFTPFETTPLISNPAFTGMFTGDLRVNAIGRLDWFGDESHYAKFAGSFDMPVLYRKKSYVAAGVQLYRGRTQSTIDFYGVASVSFHQAIGNNLDFGVGLQAGYSQTSLDYDGLAVPAPGNFYETTHAYPVNAGVSMSYSVTKSFNYTLGVSLNNIDNLNKKLKSREFYNSEGVYYTVTAGANWQAGQRFTIRPAVSLQVFDAREYWFYNGNYVVAGNEVRFKLTKSSQSKIARTSVFAGVWYKTDDVITITGGIEHGRFRASFGGDSHGFSWYAGNAFEASLRYIVPERANKKYERKVPCTRF